MLKGKHNKQKNYNLIVIVIDALRAQNLSCYGYPQKTSPFIDSLAKKGIFFENFFSCSDHTDPSFTTIFTGRFPITHGILAHGPNITTEQKKDLDLTKTKFLAELLKEKNKDMVTICIDWLGRWHKRGFDIYGEDNIIVDKKGIFCKYKWLNEKVKLMINRFSLEWYYLFSNLLQPYGFKCRGDAEGHFDYARYALNKFAKNKNFFLHIHIWDVHPPLHLIPQGFVRKFEHGKKEGPIEESFKKYKSERFKKSAQSHHLKNIRFLSEIEERYNGAINYVDTELSKFIGFLKNEGLWDHTYLFITGDHGERLVENGIYLSHGGTTDKIMRVPFILLGPNIPKKRIQNMAQHTDIFPTVLELFEITGYRKYDGSSLMPLIKGQDIKWDDEIFFVAGAANKRYTLLNERYKYNYSPTKKDAYHHSQVWYKERVELYDMKDDPNEQHNIVKEKPVVAELMEKRLKQILKKLKRNKESYILDYSILKNIIPRQK